MVKNTSEIIGILIIGNGFSKLQEIMFAIEITTLIKKIY